MRIFREFEKDYLEQFLASQSSHDKTVLDVTDENQRVRTKVLENYLEFNKSGISARLNCVFTDHVEQIKGNCEIFS